MTKREATTITGGLGKPSKMPGKSYGLPARECGIGSKLQLIQGSTCEHCYALRGQYVFPVVQRAQYRRLRSLSHPMWIEAMVALLRGEKYFRWHDSGDLQSVMHLSLIVAVCRATPDVQHWLPTREYKIVRNWRKMFGEFPANLCVRLSAHIVDTYFPGFDALPVSMVHTRELPANVQACPAPQQGNNCRDCRACWNRKTHAVSYHIH